MSRKSLPPLPTADLDLILESTAFMWEEMRGQRIFLTGGTGFFGSWLLESFAHINRALNLNARATVLSRDPEAFLTKCPHLATESSISFLRGDVRFFKFPAGDFRYVIHAATTASMKQLLEEPLEMYTTMVYGMEHTLKFASSHGTQKFLFPSSGAIYGKQPDHITHIPEDYLGGPDPLDPGSVYAEGKRISEQVCAVYARQTEIEIKIARCFTFVGPHLPLDAHFAIGNFLRDAIAGQTIASHGDGTPVRSYLYTADLAIALWTLLFKAPSMQAFNIGSEESISIAALAGIVRDAINPRLEVKIAGHATPGAIPARYVPSTKRGQQMLNLKPHISLAEAIRRTAAWHNQT
jgi:nucleoside-diphosphate-sugar epimerase